MSLVSATQVGQTWRWGFKAADAPQVGNGWYPVEAEVRYGPEVYSKSQDGEGHTDSVTVSKADKRQWDATFKGRIDDTFDPASFPVSFPWNGRTFIIKPGGIGHAMPKGEYHEVAVETESFALTQ